MSTLSKGLKWTLLGALTNALLALVKITAGILGNSYALIADGIESATDVFSSLVVWSSLKISARPPDECHPYGHGKAESLAALMVSVFLLGAVLLIAVQSFQSMAAPHKIPSSFTLFVLAGVILIKEILFRKVFATGETIRSGAMKTDAWHHRSDALTSTAAFIGISIALIGGPGYEAADNWAALFACVIITYNGVHLFRNALDEVMDAAPGEEIERDVREVASKTQGVVQIEKCRIRKSGTQYIVDIHVQVEGEITVAEGHAIGHQVKGELCSSGLGILDVLVHIEPAHGDCLEG